MSKTKQDLTTLIEDLETLGSKISFLLTAATSDEPLSAKARVGLIEFGNDSIQALGRIEDGLKIYRASCTVS
ncbi:hypothetical protein [Pseudomonas fragi]|uniref:Uncharacterized protein n=1 Tax=Pseudomonas fragi TaxID=296 RepID=A0A9Q6YEQ0_PSEFR|nr:hypothetical protein [Pseudomonas fragi]QPL31946.1 hypothetical protein I5R27_02140 [Pseudomonas fragi]